MNVPTPIVHGTDTSTATAPDPFDLSALRLSQNFLETAGVKKQLLTVPVRKPNPQDFVRVHPDPAYRADLLAVELKDDRETYVVRPQPTRRCVSLAGAHSAAGRQGQ
jgi:hypothetical protein